MRIALEILIIVVLVTAAAALLEAALHTKRKPHYPCPAGTPGLLKEIKHTKGIWV